MTPRSTRRAAAAAGASPSVSGLDSSDEAEEEEVTFVPISLGTADLQASLPDYLKVCAGNPLCAARGAASYGDLPGQQTQERGITLATERGAAAVQ